MILYVCNKLCNMLVACGSAMQSQNSTWLIYVIHDSWWFLIIHCIMLLEPERWFAVNDGLPKPHQDRNKFSKLCDSLRVDQPEWSQFATLEEARRFCKTAGYPVLVRPSYVLSGAAMRVVTNDDDLDLFLKTAAVVSQFETTGTRKKRCTLAG